MALTKMRLNWGVNTPVKIKIDNQAEESYTGSYKDVELQEGEHTVKITIVETNKTITVPLLVPKSIPDRMTEMQLFPESEKEALQNQINTLTNEKTTLETNLNTCNTEKTTLTNQVTTLNNEKSALQVSIDEKIQEINDASQGYIDILEFSSDRKIIKFNTTDKFKTGWKVYAKSANAETEIQPNTNINNGVAIDALLVKNSNDTLKDTIDMNFTIAVPEPLPDFNSIFNKITENTYISQYNKFLIMFKNNTGRKLYYNKVTRSGLSNSARSSFNDGAEIGVDKKMNEKIIFYYDDLNGQYPNVKREYVIDIPTGIWIALGSGLVSFVNLNDAISTNNGAIITNDNISISGTTNKSIVWNLDKIFDNFYMPKSGSYAIAADVEFHKSASGSNGSLEVRFGIDFAKYDGKFSDGMNIDKSGAESMLGIFSLSQIFDYEAGKELSIKFNANSLTSDSSFKVEKLRLIKIK